MTGFVQGGHHILMRADGVDEYKRFADGSVGGAICAGSLVLAVVKVGQAFGNRAVEVAAQHRVHVVEDG